MAEAVIKLSLQEEELLSDLKRVSGGFDSVAKHIEGVEKNTAKLNKQANTAANVFKGLFTLEMGKKMFAFADATLRSAEAMEGLNAESKAGAKNYLDMADSIKEIATNITLWAAGIGGATGTMQSLRNLAVETADAWAYALGLQTSMEKQINKQNEQKVMESELIILRSSLNATKAELQKESVINNEDFYIKAIDYAKQTESELDKLGKKMGLTANQLTAFKSGSSLAEIQNSVAMDAFSSRLQKSLEAPQAKSIKEIDWEKIKSDRLDALADLRDQAAAIQEQEIQDQQEYIKTAREIDKELAASQKEGMDAISEIRASMTETELDELENSYAKKKEMHLENAEYQNSVDNWYFAERKRMIEEEQQRELEKDAAIYQGAATMFGGLSQLAAASAGKNKELAKLSLDLAELEAIANTAAGVTMAYRQGGVAGLLTGIGVAAAGTAQVATIEKQEQKLATGGIVVGATSGDTVEVMANGGEMMLTKADQTNLLGMIRNGGSGGMVINATFSPQYSRDTDTLTKIRDNREFVATLRTLQANPSYNRASGALI